jgi:uncharacterized protein (TIGR03382 family)
MFFAEVDGIGGAGVIHAGPAPGVFGGGDPSDFSAPAVASLHTTLNDDGVQTDGRVTFLLLETDNGLSFATLVDRVELVDNPRGIPPEDLALAMVSTAPTSAPGRVFDNPNDLDPIFQSGGRNIASGDFFWASGLAFDGSAHAWTNLAQGDFVTYSFTERPETIGPNALSTDPTFQFATYDNESGTWSLLPSSGVTNDGNFTDLGQFAFSAEIVPAPGAALPMLGAGLAVLGRRRRR